MKWHGPTGADRLARPFESMARKRHQEEQPEAARVVNVLPVKKKPRAKTQAQAQLSSARHHQSKPRELVGRAHARSPKRAKFDVDYTHGQLLRLMGDADVDSEELDEALDYIEDEKAGESYVEELSTRTVERSDRSTRSSATQFAAVDADDQFKGDEVDEEAELDEEEGAVEGEEDQDEEEEEEEEVAAPVVFQCGTCRSIFGDSYAFVGANADLLLVTLSDVTNVARAPETQTAKDGADAGSSFRELLCKQCQAVLGRQYLTTPIALDELRGLYSFSTAAIASYQLGYPQLESQREPLGADAAKRATAACDATVRSLAADRDELLRLREDMTKVQNLLLVVDERLRSLETEEPDSEADEGANVPVSAIASASTTGTPVKR